MAAKMDTEYLYTLAYVCMQSEHKQLLALNNITAH